MAHDIFISHVEEDQAIALAMADGLEQKGYSTWFYERDSVIGHAYIKNIPRAIEQSKAFLLLISANSLESNQVHIEVVHAHECEKPFIPILYGVPYNEVKTRRPEWHYVLAASVGAPVSSEEVADILPAIIRGLKEFGIDANSASLGGRSVNLPPDNPYFTDREQVLRELSDIVKPGSRVALFGLPGVGKTQTAIHYAHQHRDDYRTILYTLAENTEALESGFVALAQSLGLPQKDAKDNQIIVQAVKRWLESQADWLLLLDNADDLESVVISDLLPSSEQGAMLLTTRVEAVGPGILEVEIKQIPREDGAKLLLRRAKRLEKADESEHNAALVLSEQLGDLPLALDQAGAYIDDTKITTADYLALYEEEALKRELLGTPDRYARNRASVESTFSIAFERVEQRNLAAADLLRCCAFLAPDAIPEKVFNKGASYLGDHLGSAAAHPLRWNTVLKVIRDLSLLRQDVRQASARTLTMHRLVQEVLREKLSADEQRLWADRAVKMICTAYPHEDFSHWHCCFELLAHQQVCVQHIQHYHLESAEAAMLLNQTAYGLKELGRFTEANELFERALAMAERIHGSEHADIATILNCLGDLRRVECRHLEAEPYYRQALEIRRNVFTADHADTALSLNDLGLNLYYQGRYDEAEQYLEQSLAMREKVFGSSDPVHHETAQSLHNLGLLRQVQGQYEETRTLFERALAGMQADMPDGVDVAVGLGCLSSVYSQLGDYTIAEQYCKRSLEIRDRVLGTNHPDTMECLFKLGNLYMNRAKYQEAGILFECALSKTQADCSNELYVANIFVGLVNIYVKLGDSNMVEQYCQRLLAIRDRLLGTDHPDAMQWDNTLANLYFDLAKYEEAEKMYQHALSTREKYLGPEHPDTEIVRSNILNNQAMICKVRGDYESAETYYQRALEIREKVRGPEHPDTARMLQRLAELHELQGNYPEAESFYQRVISSREKELGNEHPDTVIARNKYADLLRKMGRDDKVDRIIPTTSTP